MVSINPMVAVPAPNTTQAAARALFVRRAGWRWEEILFWVLAAASYFIFPGHLVLITQAMITGLFVVSLDVMFGYAGIPSFGHAAFFGIGAYTAGILARDWWGDPLVGLAAGALVAGLAGAICSQIVARLHGIAMLMVTLGIGLICYEIANKWNGMTGGDDGLQGMQVTPLLGLFTFDIDGKVGFVYSFIVIFLLYLLARRLVNSPFGLALKGIRENVRRVPALGIGVRVQLAMAFTISAAMAGVAGALLAETTQYHRARGARLRPLDLGADRARARRHRQPDRRHDRRHRLYRAARPALADQSGLLGFLGRADARHHRDERHRRHHGDHAPVGRLGPRAGPANDRRHRARDRRAEPLLRRACA